MAVVYKQYRFAQEKGPKEGRRQSILCDVRQKGGERKKGEKKKEEEKSLCLVQRESKVVESG